MWSLGKEVNQIGVQTLCIALFMSLSGCSQLLNNTETKTDQLHIRTFPCTQLTGLVHDQSGQNTTINFVNPRTETVDIYWIEQEGTHQKYLSLAPGKSQVQPTFTHHYWIAKTSDGSCLGIYKNPFETQLMVEISEHTGQKPPVYQPGSEPPFYGTIFLEQNIIVDSDPNAFISIAPAGMEMRTMYDRRVEKFIQTKAFLFEATYADDLTIEVQVNQEFESVSKALPYARKYARAVGFLTTELRKDVQTIWIHKGLKLFGGGNNNILIHTEQALAYEKDGILEETLVHEASHTSLDSYHARNEDWVKAQTSDISFISTYARDNPQREDISETYLLYMALRFKPDRISDQLKEIILKTIPNRIKYFDQQSFSMFPMTK
ncbi:MAG: hypothetical protein HEP71_15875 [Roseivirga sp.]|nr:hypothetical protein [Roseivirga sp.]